MSRTVLARGVLALALGGAVTAHASTDADLAAIRDEIRQLKEAYEARIKALEERLKSTEAIPARAPETATAAQAASTVSVPAEAGPAARPAAGIAAFNPAISAVLQ